MACPAPERLWNHIHPVPLLCLRTWADEPSIWRMSEFALLYRMSYKQGLISVPGLWEGARVSAPAAQFSSDFNQGKSGPRDGVLGRLANIEAIL
jgi:hypothetical protein